MRRARLIRGRLSAATTHCVARRSQWALVCATPQSLSSVVTAAECSPAGIRAFHNTAPAAQREGKRPVSPSEDSQVLFKQILSKTTQATPRSEDDGELLEVLRGIVIANGLKTAKLGEEVIIHTSPPVRGFILRLDRKTVSIAVLGKERGLKRGTLIQATGKALTVPVGSILEGRVIDPLGRPLDGEVGAYSPEDSSVFGPVPRLLARDRLTRRLVTGVKIIDVFHPLAYGSRVAVLGEQGTGKSSLAVDIISNLCEQRETNASRMHCVYVYVGQSRLGLQKIVAALKARGALAHCSVIAACSDDPASLRYLAPLAGCSLAEHFRDRGEDAFVVFDDLGMHAAAYEELARAMLLPLYNRRGVSVHGPLLERAGALSPASGGGSITVLSLCNLQRGEGSTTGGTPEIIASMHDSHVLLDANLVREKTFPAINCLAPGASLRPAPYQDPALASLVQVMRGLLSQYNQLATSAEVAKDFGLRPELDVIEALSDRSKIQMLYSEVPETSFPLAQLLQAQSFLYKATSGHVQDSLRFRNSICTPLSSLLYVDVSSSFKRLDSLLALVLVTSDFLKFFPKDPKGLADTYTALVEHLQVHAPNTLREIEESSALSQELVSRLQDEVKKFCDRLEVLDEDW